MKIAKLILCLAWFAPNCLMAQDAKVTEILSKDLTNIPGKEGLMITVEYRSRESAIKLAVSERYAGPRDSSGSFVITLT